MKKNETIQQQEPALYKALLNEVLKRSSNGLVLLNSDAGIIWCSPAAAEITGYDCDELVGKSIFGFFHPGDLPEARRHLQHLTNGQENASAFVLRIRNKNSKVRWIDLAVLNLLHVREIHALLVFLKISHDAAADERELAMAITKAKENERKFLATELHDNISPVIMASKLLVDLVNTSSGDDEVLKMASDNLKLASEEIRKLSYSMVGHDLHEFGLSIAFNRFLNSINLASGITFQTRLDEDAIRILTADQQLQVYRILQEAITNIIRHAEASQADILLSRKMNKIFLSIGDNGKGFSLNQLKLGLGLSSIKNRVKVLEGQLNLRTEKGKGTSIEIYFPM